MSDEIILYSEQDIEYYQQMNLSDLQETMEAMVVVSKRISDNYEFLENAKWYKRALATISGKVKKTQREIATDHAIVSQYCVQVVKEFVRRGLITQERVNVLEGKVNELYNQFTRLVQATGAGLKAGDDYTTFVVALQCGYYSDTLKSALSISKMLGRFDVQSEKFHINVEAVRKNIPSEPKTMVDRLLEIQGASTEDIDFYRDYAENYSGNLAKAIRLCIKLQEAGCLDEEGVLKTVAASNLKNEKLSFADFIRWIVNF